MSECECSVLPLIFKPLLAMAEGGGRPEREREREIQRDVTFKMQVVERQRRREREGGRTDKTEEGIHKKNNDQQPSSHCVRFLLLLFFFHHSHPHAALDLLFCCDDGKRDNKKGWITHTHTHTKKKTPFIVQNRLRLRLLVTSGTCWMRARQQADTANHSYSSTSAPALVSAFSFHSSRPKSIATTLSSFINGYVKCSVTLYGSD